MNVIPTIEEKCAGAFVASAIGDALGWANELRSGNTNKNIKPVSNFIEWQRRSGGRFWSHTENILAGEYSDDTQMNLAVARSILSGKPWVTHLSTVELPFWLEYERGGGGALKRAAKLWQKNTAPWKAKPIDVEQYFAAGGNGAAMRVLPHVIARGREDFDALSKQITQDAILTHGHPRAIVGALCYAYALMYMLNKSDTLSFGELANTVIDAKNEWGNFPNSVDNDWLNATQNVNYPNLWESTVNETTSRLKQVVHALEIGALDSENETLTALGCFDNRINGAGDIAAIASIYFASKYANNPILGVKSAANAIGSDTDTIASMVGGLLGALLGLSWIPAEWKLVQDYDCLVRMSRFLVSENGVSYAKEYVAKEFSKNSDWEKSPIGKCKKISVIFLPCGKNGEATISKYATILGQTIYAKKLSKEKTAQQNNKGYQQSLLQHCILKIDSKKLGVIRSNSELTKVNIAQLCIVIELLSVGINDCRQIAKETNLSETIVKKVIELITSH
jgi:ADP-ribosylglycohydrolase